MTGRVVVDEKTTEEITEAARLFRRVLHQKLGAAIPADALTAFAYSAGVQALIRSGAEGASDAVTQEAFINAAEGIGEVLGLIPDPLSRTQLYMACVQAMQVGMASQAQIHDTVGKA